MKKARDLLNSIQKSFSIRKVVRLSLFLLCVILLYNFAKENKQRKNNIASYFFYAWQMDHSDRYSYNPTLHWNDKIVEYFASAYGRDRFSRISNALTYVIIFIEFSLSFCFILAVQFFFLFSIFFGTFSEK